MPLSGSPEQRKKQVFQEFKAHQLHSGKGKKGKPGKLVTDRKQAIAIALSEAGKGRKK